MSVKAGIIGLPNVGKSTLFSALSGVAAESANYPFTTITPNQAQVVLPDHRLDRLAEIVRPQRVVPARYELVDIAGLVPGASEGAGKGNQFLTDIRQVDLLIHVIRCFEDSEVIHVQDTADPIRDLETINLELILADLQIVERALSRGQQGRLTQEDRIVLTQLAALLDGQQLLSNCSLTEEQLLMAQRYQLLTLKPMLLLANVSEHDVILPMNSRLYQQLHEYCQTRGLLLQHVSAVLEAQIANLTPHEAREYLEVFGLKHSSLEQLARNTFDLLGLATYFTTGHTEVRA